MTYSLYLVTNNINGKTYAGITGRSLRRRWSEHVCHALKNINNGHFYRAIRKHGKDKFTIELLFTYPTKEEACEAEIKYISENLPQYNSTKGGDGQLGRPMTDVGKEKIKLIHKGNSYRKGKQHTLETKTYLRELGLRNIDTFKKFAYLGPKASSKKVICLDDWMIFPSASETARLYGVSKSALIELCQKKNNRITVGGFKFSYAEDVF